MNKIRIAWWDRKESTYDYGCWQTRENLQEMEDWNEKQNILYPHVFYWIEEGNEVENTRRKLQELETEYEAAMIRSTSNKQVRQATLSSLKQLINQLKEEIARYEARQPAR